MTTIQRVRNLTAAGFVAFGGVAGIAEAVGAPTWLVIGFAGVAAVGGLVSLVLVWVEQLLQREYEAAGRFKSAAELLGDEARVGAIYLLEGVARDAPNHYHGPIVELLAAYVRERAPWPPLVADRTHPAPDVQAALTVLGRRVPRQGEPEIRLSGTDLRGAMLRGGPFARARFRGSHLEGARLEGAHLERAKFRGAHLQGVDMQADQEFGYPEASLDGAEFPGVHWDRETRWPRGFDPAARGCLPRS